jgi:hypothetical protein
MAAIKAAGIDNVGMVTAMPAELGDNAEQAGETTRGGPAP